MRADEGRLYGLRPEIAAAGSCQSSDSDPSRIEAVASGQWGDVQRLAGSDLLRSLGSTGFFSGSIQKTKF